jgi:hypothetical protein
VFPSPRPTSPHRPRVPSGSVRIRSFVELTTPNEQTLMFTPMGLAAQGKLTPESAAEFQQRCIVSANLIDVVPQATRNSFERLRTLHAYGVLCYENFTVVQDLRWIVLEQALRERFIDFYGGVVPIVAHDGAEATFEASDFEAIAKAFGRRGSHGQGWQLRLHVGSAPMRMPRTLHPLLRWARQESLLHGQRNRRLEEEAFGPIRNRFAHGAGYRLGMPNQSAGAICDLAEIINRLWGQSTLEGRLYPAPLKRAVMVVGWSHGWAEGLADSSVTTMYAERFRSHVDDPDDWTYVVLRGVPTDRLSNFDAQYEITVYPAELLWGPGSRPDALTWLDATAPTGDEVVYLDRLFAVRQHAGKVFPPYRPELLLGLPPERRIGTWHVVRADFPADAWRHVLHLERGQSCPSEGQERHACPVEHIGQGSWNRVTSDVRRLCPTLEAAEHSEVRVPSAWPPSDCNAG